MSATSPPSPRDRLLRAAEALFYGRGIRATGVEAVLAEAEVARNTLYHHFGGKDGLVAAYLEARDARWRQHWEAAIAAQVGPLERFLAILDALVTWEVDTDLARGCAFLDAEVELASREHPAAAVIDRHWLHIGARTAELAEEAGVDDPEAAARDLVLLYRGCLAAVTREPVEPVVARARALARRSITVRPRVGG